MIKNLNNNDKITINLFGRQTPVTVFSVDLLYEDEEENGALSEEEINCLNRFIENININDYKEEILTWYNQENDKIGQKHITKNDLENDVDIFSIAISVTADAASSDGRMTYPEIAFYGWCDNIDKGICIGFRDGKFIGIGYQDWIL